MVAIKGNRAIDFSFIPSLECDLLCPFCMYDAGPDKKEVLDIKLAKEFVNTIDWSYINSWGFYGGEPAINLPLYQSFIDLIPKSIPKFIITNGTWSIDTKRCLDFLSFLEKNSLHIVISGTTYHKKFQNELVLKGFKTESPKGITLKGDDKIQPMGRASIENWQCSKKCQSLDVPIRLGMFPNGDILFQNCNGVYPIVQKVEESFDGIIDRVKHVINKCKERRF